MNFNRRKGRKAAVCAACAVLMLALCGCWDSNELDKLAIVLGSGVDLAPEDPAQLLFTVQLAKPGEIHPGKDSGGSGGEAYWNINGVGDSIFNTLRELESVSGRQLFLSHSDLLVFGLDAAEDGIQDYLDFFNHDPQVRGKLRVAVSETTAQDILNVKPNLEKTPSDEIVDLVRQYASETSQVPDVKVVEFIRCFMDVSTASVMPILKLEQQGEREVVRISGTAVFQGDKMVGRLDKTEGRGFLFMIGKVKRGAMTVYDRDGKRVDVVITHTKTKMTPVLKDGTVSMRIEITAEENVTGQESTKNLTGPSEVAYLNDQVDREIKREVAAALKKARSLETDIFGFATLIEKKRPDHWREMKDGWDELFQTIEVDVQVKSALRMMGKFPEPLVPERGNGNES